MTTQTLEEMNKDYAMLLIDTSSLIKPIGMCNEKLGPFDTAERILRVDTQLESLDFFKKYLEKRGRLFTTEGVLEEYAGNNYYSHNKKVKEKGGFGNGSRINLDYSRMIDESCIKKRRLAEIFINQRKVVWLDDIEKGFYKYFFGRWHSQKEKLVLSDVDYDLFLTGAVIGKFRYNAAIISDDSGISRLWKLFIKSERNFTSNRFGFFRRTDRFLFEKL